MKRLIIHVGYAKTSTTTLQKQVFPFLSGLDYCGKFHETDRVQNFGLTSLLPAPPALYSKPDPKSLKIFKEKIFNSQYSLIVISREGYLTQSGVVGGELLSHYPQVTVEKNVEALKYWLNSALGHSIDVSILITFREQLSLLQSVMEHQLRSKRFENALIKTPFQFLLYLEKNNLLEYFNFFKTINLFKNAFGASNVLGIPMEGLYDLNNNLTRKSLANFMKVSHEELNNLFLNTTITNSTQEIIDSGKKTSFSMSSAGVWEPYQNQQYSQKIKKIYKPLNELLNKSLSINLESYGYSFNEIISFSGDN